MDRLYDKLIQYSKGDYYPMHMPGHKRNMDVLSMGNPYGIDITEIEGFDNLHQPEGILRDLALRLQKLYGSDCTYPLINGSSVGILIGIAAMTSRGDKVLIARNCHKSVYHGAMLQELEPIYIYPEVMDEIPIVGGILPEKIEELLIKHSDIKLVVITSPTYEGIVSDIGRISEIVHEYGALLLVDEAHGAHFGFHEALPQSAITLGADIVVQSLHKTLPAFTQTAVLHSNRRELRHKVEKYLSIFQSSSPSYLLLAGIDRCVSILEDQSEGLFSMLLERLMHFYSSVGELTYIKLLNRAMVGRNGVYELDPSKLTIYLKATTMTGKELSDKLRNEYHIEMEMDALDYVLGIASICDKEEGFKRLEYALSNIDQELRNDEKGKASYKLEVNGDHLYQPEQVMTPFIASEQAFEEVELEEALNRISASYISIYPPGIPLIVPGERIQKKILNKLRDSILAGLNVTGLSGLRKDRIEVIIEGQEG